MSSRKVRTTRVRAKVIALLVSLAALWGFAAFVTVREGLNLLSVSALDQGASLPAEELIGELQRERLLTQVYLGDPDAAREAAMVDQRSRTDEKITNFISRTSSGSVRFAASPLLESRLDATAALTGQLADHRRAIDAGDYTRGEARAVFDDLIDSAFSCFDALSALDDDAIAKDVRTLIQLNRASELLSREDALLQGALAVGALSAEEHAEFAQLVGAQRYLFTSAIIELPDADRQAFEGMLDSPVVRTVRTHEDAIITAGPTGQPGTGLVEWAGAAGQMREDAYTQVRNSGNGVVERSIPLAVGVVVRVALAGVLGLVAVIASIVISITTARQLVRQLERLRNAARDLASYRLPRVVERLQQGEQVDVKQEAPPLEFGNDEIGQVGEAFNQVQETAIRVAVEQAELRRSVRDVFLSLARRSQALLHRQLGLLDAMERRATDSEELAELFRIDHLATRMRRNAENLIVLSGATAGRAWRKPVPMVDVLRGALAEVEDYTRVTVLPVGNASLLGRAVGDVIHLLAELIENAVSFSPPQTTVRVGGSVVGYGFAIEIEDRGLGMSPEELATANEQLRDPPEFRLTSTARLGLYVVAKLAERHGIRVRLTESAYGGTTAIVLLPGSILAEDGTDGGAPPDLSQLDSYRPAQLAGAGRHRLQTDIADRARGEVATAVAVRGPDESADRMEAASGAALARDVEAAPVSSSNGSNGQPTALAPVAAQLPAPTDLPARPAPTDLPARPAPTDLPALPAPAGAEAAPSVATGTGEAADSLLTPSGLPLRPRRTAEAEPAAGTGVTDPPPPRAPTGRDPDATRSLMASYRSGTLRGRSDAARIAEEQAGNPPVPPTSADPATAESPQWTQSTPMMRETEEGG